MKRKYNLAFGIVIIIFVMIFNLTYQIHGIQNISTANYCYDNFIEDFKLNKENVSVGDSITFTFSITDESKIFEVSATYVRNGGPFPQFSTPIYLKKLENGQYVGAISITNSFYKDYYRINIILLDKNGDTMPINKSLTFFVNDGISDVVGPVIEKVELSSKNVKVGDKLIVTLKVTDESEIEEVTVAYNQEWNSNGRQIIATKKDDGTYVAEIEITDKFFKDRYIISTGATDIYGNSASSSKSVDFYVLDGISDVVGPVIEKVELSSKNVKVGDKLIVTLKVTDESEIEEVTVAYNQEWNSNGRQIIATKKDDGTYVAEIEITDKFFKDRYIISTGATDIYGNSASSSKSVDFYVLDGISDFDGPLIEKVELSSVEVLDGDILGIVISASDESEISEVIVSYTKSDSFTGRWLNAHKVDEGQYYVEIPITQEFKKGAYQISVRGTDIHGTYGNEKTEIFYVGHNYVKNVIEPTCTEQGYTLYKCIMCGDSYKDETIVPKLDHDYSKEWTIDKDATCTESGSKSHHCTRCDSKSDVTIIPKTSHNYDEGVITTKATCTKDGVKTYTCKDCKTTKTEELKALGHDYSKDWTIDKKATCLEEGSKFHHCTRCDSKKDVTVISKLYHNYDEGVITTSPTCTKDGVKTYTCKDCKTTKTEELKALGHDYSKDWTIDKDATCTESGSKSHHCTRCDSKSDVTVIPKLSHNWILTSTVNPTRDHEGKKVYTCNLCKETKEESIPILVGKWVSNSVGKWYEYSDGTYENSGFKKIENETYYFTSNGYVKTGWLSVNNNWYFFKNSGCMVTSNWVGSYYMDSEGKMKTNSFTPDEYYCGADGVYVRNAWIKYNGNYYYMNANGLMRKNAWAGAYYLDADGVMKTNAFTPDGYYVGADGAYLRNQKIEVDGKEYYLNAAGKVAKNQWVGDYFIDGNGNVVKNHWTGNYWCGADGRYVKSSWVDDGRYYVGSNGVYVTNQWIGDYYLNGAGLVTKNAWVGNYWCGSDGKYVRSSWVDNNQYYVGANGVYVPGRWVAYGSRWCYYAGNVYAKDITLNIDGIFHTFDSNGYMIN